MSHNLKPLIVALSLFAGSASICLAEVPPPVEELYVESQNEEGPLKRKEVGIIKVTATIQKLDKDDRVATLLLPNEKEITLKVSPMVKRLDEINEGDQVQVKYLESLAFEVREPTATEKENPSKMVVEAAKKSAELPPGAAAAVVAHSIVEITGIDMEKEMVEFKFPKGDVYTMKAKVPENLKRIKVGDTVAVTYAEAMAVEIEPMKKSS